MKLPHFDSAGKTFVTSSDVKPRTTRNVLAILAVLLAVVVFLLYPRIQSSRTISAPVQVRLAAVPATAEIIYHVNGFIYVMDRDGGNVTQITFDRPRPLEHVALSYDRRYVVANQPGSSRRPSILWVMDLVMGTEAQLVPDFVVAGPGGVDWDPDGYIYFAGLERRWDRHTDVFRIMPDGSALQKLTDTPEADEFDVSVSALGVLLCYVKDYMSGRPDEFTELWANSTQGGNEQMLLRSGKVRVASAHDPEFSPDNSKIVFSMVNQDVPPNWPADPIANTAHDLFTMKTDGSDLTRLTAPGPISIIPDWKDDRIVYTELNEKDNYRGASIVSASRSDQPPKRIMSDANAAKWIP